MFFQETKWLKSFVMKGKDPFNGLVQDCSISSALPMERERDLVYRPFEDRGHQGPYSPYKPFNHNLYIGIIIFPHTDNPQSTGYN